MTQLHDMNPYTKGKFWKAEPKHNNVTKMFDTQRQSVAGIWS